MNAPRTRPDFPAPATPIRSERTTVLETRSMPSAERRSDAELHRAIESAASRLLGLALARGVEERDPDEE